MDMKPATTRTRGRHWVIAPALMALTIAAVVGGMAATPAQADDDDWGRGQDRGRQMHRQDQMYRQEQMHRHERYRDHGDYELRSYGPPSYVYAPPPVYYAPPPGPPVIDFVFPLRFR